MTQPTDRFDPTLPSVLWRYKALIVAIVAAFTALALLYSASVDDKWSAEASLVVRDPETAVLFEQGLAQKPERYLANQSEIITSDVVISRAVEILAESDPELDIDSSDIDDGLSVESTTDRDQLVLTATSAQEARPLPIVNAVAAAYQEVREQMAKATFSDALTQVEVSIVESTAELDELQSNINALRLSPGARDQLNAGFEEAIGLFAEAVAGLDADTAFELSGLQAELQDLELQLSVLTTLIDAEADTEETNIAYDALVERAGRIPLELSVARLLAPPDLATLQDSLLTIQAVLEIETQDPELVALAAEQDDAIKRLSDLKQQRDELQVDAELADSGVVFFSPALSSSLSPAKTTRIVGMAVLAGGALAVALSYLLAVRKPVVREAHDPRSVLGAPLVGQVPKLKRRSRRLPVLDDPTSGSAESFRFIWGSIRSTIASLPAPVGDDADPPGHVVAIVSSMGGDGKTVVAANTALAAAREGKRVLVIDGDFRHRGLTSLLLPDRASDIGLTDVIAGGVALDIAVAKVKIDSSTTLHVLTSGTTSRGVPRSEFFDSEITAARLKAVTSRFDVVIIDTPPILSVAYASQLATLASGVVAVVPRGGAAEPMAEMAEQLDSIGASVWGYVFNKAIHERYQYI